VVAPPDADQRGFFRAAGTSGAGRQARGGPVIFLAVLLAMFTLLGTAGLILDFAVGKLLPSLQGITGVILLILAVMPWLGELIFCVITTLMP